MLCKELSNLLEDGNFLKVTLGNVIVLSVVQALFRIFVALDYAKTVTDHNVVLRFFVSNLTIIGLIFFIIADTPLN